MRIASSVLFDVPLGYAYAAWTSVRGEEGLEMRRCELIVRRRSYRLNSGKRRVYLENTLPSGYCQQTWFGWRDSNEFKASIAVWETPTVIGLLGQGRGLPYE